MVHEVLSNDILSLPYTNPVRKPTEALLKQILIYLLIILDFLYSECYIIYTSRLVPLVSNTNEDISSVYFNDQGKSLALGGAFVNLIFIF